VRLTGLFLPLAILFVGGCGGSADANQASASATAIAFPELTGRVVDQADLLTPAQEEGLAARSVALEKDIGPQFVVVTVPTLQGYAIEEYGVSLGRHWGIGSKERNDGVLLIVAPVERMVRIEVGYGLEQNLSDPYAAKVIREITLPHFRNGDFPEGIDKTSAAIIDRLRSRRTDNDFIEEKLAA
jgi:uncharacterized protein